MADITVFFADDAKDDAEWLDRDAWERGFRHDVYVKVGDEYFRLAVFDTVRLIQDFQTELNDNGFYSPEPNLILVPEVSKQQIVATINGIYKKAFFFEMLKPVEDEVVARHRMQSHNS